MERARDMLEHGGHLSEQGLKVRFSLGCATTEFPSRLHEAIRAADMAMYEDKKIRKQKNRELLELV
jgi:PleD family two-component response regulator